MFGPKVEENKEYLRLLGEIWLARIRQRHVSLEVSILKIDKRST
jgi:hypothetical protein